MKQLINKIKIWVKDLNKRRPKVKTLKACMVYYQVFNSLLYREAMTLKGKGFEVDIVCIRKSKKVKILDIFDEINLYQIQARPFAEKKSILYFIHLGLFFIKSFGLLTFLEVFKRYNLIHITAPPDVMVFASVIPKILGAKIILDIHDIGPELYMRKLSVKEDEPIIKLIKYLEKISGLFADHVIVVNDLWKEKLINRSIPVSKCSVVLNVPDDNIFNHSYVNNSLKKNNNFNLYYHGSLEEHFGVDTILEAMPKIIKHVPNVTLHIYGGEKGRLYEKFIYFVKKSNLKDFVKFYKFVPFYKLPKILSDANLGIVPTKGSVFSEEAVSMKSLEYMALGIPICISKTKAHRYYYDSSMVKFFEPGNSYDLAMGVIYLHGNPAEREKLVGNSLKFIGEHGWTQEKKEYINIIDQLVL